MMQAARLTLAAIVIAVFAGMANEAQAGGWVVRVEVQNQFNGHKYYPTLYSSSSYNDAREEYYWYEFLMKKYPSKFRSDVLDELDVPWYYKPVRMHLVYLQGINPTGHQY